MRSAAVGRFAITLILLGLLTWSCGIARCRRPRRNTMLTVRFLVNIARCWPDAGTTERTCSRSGVTSKAATRSSTSSPGAIAAGVGGSRAPSGRTVLEEFMVMRSVDRLRTGDIYADTEAVLGAIADDMGLGDRVRSWFRNPGYVSESLFYAFAGSPEHVHLRTPWA